MKTVGKLIFEKLTANAGFNAVMGSRLYPVIGLSDVKTPFSVYRLRQAPGSLDVDEFDVTVFSFFEANKATEAMDFNDEMVDFFKDSDEFFYVSSEIDYMDENQQVILMFNLKIFKNE